MILSPASWHSVGSIQAVQIGMEHNLLWWCTKGFACKAVQNLLDMLQGYQNTIDEMDVKLSRIADLAEQLKELKTKHEMTAAQNVDMFVKLQVGPATQQTQPVSKQPALICTSYQTLLVSRLYSALGSLIAILQLRCDCTCARVHNPHTASTSCMSDKNAP